MLEWNRFSYFNVTDSLSFCSNFVNRVIGFRLSLLITEAKGTKKMNATDALAYFQQGKIHNITFIMINT